MYASVDHKDVNIVKLKLKLKILCRFRNFIWFSDQDINEVLEKSILRRMLEKIVK